MSTFPEQELAATTTTDRIIHFTLRCFLICLRFCIIWSLFHWCCSSLWNMFWANNSQRMNYNSFLQFYIHFRVLHCNISSFILLLNITVELLLALFMFRYGRYFLALISCALFIRPSAHLRDRYRHMACFLFLVCGSADVLSKRKNYFMHTCIQTV